MSSLNAADDRGQHKQRFGDAILANSPSSATPDRAGRPYLSPNQQHLLVNALASQAGSAARSSLAGSAPSSSQTDNSTMNVSTSSGMWTSPQNLHLDGYDVGYTPELDYLDGESFDFENADLGGDMIGALPGSGAEQHEKRKTTDDSGDEEGGDVKRQEGEKIAKKPGRKPLTSEPTTKRKAQNRAAQRAFRERKEKHLKDLETKVSELTKADQASKQENGVLKAQVQRLTSELREYRKRLSMNGSTGLSTSPISDYTAKQSNNSASRNNSYPFELFPKIGSAPSVQSLQKSNSTDGALFNNVKFENLTPPGSISSPSNSIQGSVRQTPPASGHTATNATRSLSTDSVSSGTAHGGSPSQMANQTFAFSSYSSQNNMHGFGNTFQQMGHGADGFEDLFSPSILKGTNMDKSGQYFTPNTGSLSENLPTNSDPNGDNTHSGLSRVFQFNSNAGSTDSTSPSACSSNWNVNANSSCGTSPEPLLESPGSKDKIADTFAPVNETNLMQSQESLSNFGNYHGFTNDFTVPSVANFDPVLFGDYRDSNEAIVGDGDFTGGFFDDALHNSSYDTASPSNLFGILKSPSASTPATSYSSNANNTVSPSQFFMAEVEKARNGGQNEPALPNTELEATASKSSKMVSCNNIWSQLQSNPDFQDGKFDLDSLCSELRSKARCSHSGVIVDQEHVDAALRRLGKADSTGKIDTGSDALLFPESSMEKMFGKWTK